MKSLLIGVLVLGSLTAQADIRINCFSNLGQVPLIKLKTKDFQNFSVLSSNEAFEVSGILAVDSNRKHKLFEIVIAKLDTIGVAIARASASSIGGTNDLTVSLAESPTTNQSQLTCAISP